MDRKRRNITLEQCRAISRDLEAADKALLQLLGIRNTQFLLKTEQRSLSSAWHTITALEYIFGCKAEKLERKGGENG